MLFDIFFYYLETVYIQKGLLPKYGKFLFFRLSSMRSKQITIALNNSCNYFRTSTLKVDEINSVAEYFKIELRSISREEISNLLGDFQK